MNNPRRRASLRAPDRSQPRWTIGLLLLALGSAATARAQSASPFDTAGARSEQTRYYAEAPQLVGAVAGDAIAIATQLYAGGTPTQAKVATYRRAGPGYAPTGEATLPLARLVGLTSDGTSFYAASAVLEDIRKDLTTTTYRPNVLVLSKLSATGAVLWTRDVNGAAYLGDVGDKGAASAIYSPLTAGTGALAYGGGKIAIALASNTLPDMNIRERHQRAQYFVVNADGAPLKAASETSWRHSFDQRLLFDGTDFVFTDLGDAGWYMPGAGIALRKIKPTAAGATFVGDLQGVYVYVRQAETAGAQNFSFTSLGDLERGASGYVAVFASEKSNPGATRDGWQTPVAEPRNVGFVHVTKGFDAVAEGSWDGRTALGNTVIAGEPTAINVSRSVVDSGSDQPRRFTRPGNPAKTFTQVGIVWLTDLPAGVSAERPKVVRVASDRYVVLWEEWSYGSGALAYQATKGMVVSEAGQVVKPAAAIGARLNPRGADRPLLIDGRATWIATAGGRPTLYAVDASLTLSTPSLTASASTPTTPSTPAALRSELRGEEALLPGDKIQSPNGRYVLTYQTDGNLVLYAGTQALWASGTNGRPVGRAIMQTDGNLCIYGPTGAFVWNTGTVSPGSRLVMQDDGNLVIYRADGSPAWASGTQR